VTPPERIYRVGRSYRDAGSSTDPDDQLLRWVNLEGSGIRNMGGIRPLRFLDLPRVAPAYVMLFTDLRSQGSDHNPWDDSVKLREGRIGYWGDAKLDPKRSLDDFVGNRALVSAWDMVQKDQRDLIPPFLHFTKVSTGFIAFNGLFVLEGLSIETFRDRGQEVRNYLAELARLSVDEVDVAWLQRRVRARGRSELRNDGPTAWRAYQSGVG
jgi:hypothetical protein